MAVGGSKGLGFGGEAYHTTDDEKVSRSAHSPYGLDNAGYDYVHDADALA